MAMRAGWVDDEKLNMILAEMKPDNSLELEVSLATGLRIGDVLNLDTVALLFGGGGLTLHEQKTGKKRKIEVPESLLGRMREICGPEFIFPHRLHLDKHRTRQAVWKDIKRACRTLKIKPHRISPHSMRKIYAVREFKRTGSIESVQESLNHSSHYTTTAYAFADQL
jgi:integrase